MLFLLHLLVAIGDVPSLIAVCFRNYYACILFIKLSACHTPAL